MTLRKHVLAMIFNNFGYKAAAVILATLLWYTVQGEEVLEINRRIVVNVTVPDNLMIKGSTTRFKDATLRGPRVLLGDFPRRDLEAQLRIIPGQIGQRRYRIDRDHIVGGWDQRISLTVHEPYVLVTVDEKATKTVPVRPVLQGAPAEGSMVERSQTEPETITLTGLKTELARIKEVLTEPIDVTGLSTSKNIEANVSRIGLVDAELSTQRVTVKLSIGEQKINKRFPSVPVEVTGSEYVSAIKPQQVEIIIQGTPGVLERVKNSDLRAFVEVRELAPGRYEREIKVKIPPETTLIETIPANAAVEIYNQKRLN